MCKAVEFLGILLGRIKGGGGGEGGEGGSIEPPKFEELTSKLVKRVVIPTFFLTLTFCCELVVLCQSLQPTTSEQTVLFSLSKDIYAPP